MNRNSPLMAVVLAGLMVLSALSISVSAGANETAVPMPAGTGTQNQPDSASMFVSHIATSSDIEMMKANYGVRDPAKKYGMEIGGYKMGLAPTREETYDVMAGNVKIIDGTASPLSLPSSVDHSAEPCFPIVGTQTTNGCAAFATSYYANGYQQGHDKGWTGAKTGDTSELLTPTWVYNKVNGGFDGGSSLADCAMMMKFMGNSKWGTISESDAMTWGDETAWRQAPEFRCGAVTVVNTPFTGKIDIFKAAVASGHCVCIGINGYMYSNGLGAGDDTISSGEFMPSPTHANTVVGYDDSKGEKGETGSFKIVNSWGPDWGAVFNGHGYYWMTYKAFEKIDENAVFFDDLPQYCPRLLATCKLSPQGYRNANITLGLGDPAAPAKTIKPPLDGGSYIKYPSFMCFDITEFTQNMTPGSTSFFLNMIKGKSASTITSFKVEVYNPPYAPGSPANITGESPDVPKASPCNVTVSFDNTYFPEFPAMALPLGALLLVALAASARRRKLRPK